MTPPQPETAEGRRIHRIVSAHEGTEGAGFRVQRPFPSFDLARIDPFLLMDEMGPSDHGPSEAKGAPDHPHRGFETVTYMLSGSFEHRDSQGNHGILKAGDVQWMTAGAGVIHSEMPERSFFEKGGRLHGVQLWVNLPKKDKMTAPRYQDKPSKDIPVARSEDGKVTVKVIAGKALGVDAVVQTHTPMLYFHVVGQPGGKVTLPIPRDHQGFVYVIDGEAAVGSDRTTLRDAQLGVLTDDHDNLTMEVPPNATRPFSGLVIAGIPLREPIFQYGPFVMTNPTEIQEAIRDFQLGRFGNIPATVA